MDVLARRIERESDEVELPPVVDRETLLAMQARDRARARRRRACASTASTSSRRRGPRRAPRSGASPRGSLALLKLARCRAALQGRDYVLPDDVKAVAVPALAHRLVLRPELWVQRVSAEDVVREVLDDRPDAAGRGRRSRATRVTRTGSPRLDGYASLAAVGLVGRARAPPARARRRRSAVRAPPRDRHAHGTRAAHLGRRSSCASRTRARGRPRSTPSLERRAPIARSTGSSSCSSFREASRSSTASRRARAPPPRRRERASCASASAARAGASSTSAGIERARARRAPARDLGGALRATRSASRPIRAPMTLQRLLAAARDAGIRGKRGRAGEGRRRRVRGHPRLRAGRPCPLDQLARVGPPSGPRRERAPSGAEHGRRALRRQLHGRARRRAELARGRRPRRRVRSRPATSSVATGSGSSGSAACSAGSSPGWARPSATGSSRRCSRRASSRRTRGATSTSSRRASSRRSRSCSALTPLVDQRFIAALEDLRARRFDVAVVEVDPVPLVEPGRVGGRPARLPPLAPRARGAPRAARALGIGVATWGDDELDTVLEEVRTYRRYARLARA